MGIPAAQAFAQTYGNIMAYATLEESGPLAAALLGLNIQGPVFNNPYTGLGFSGAVPSFSADPVTGFGGTGAGSGGAPGAGEGPDAGVGEAP